MSGSDFYQLTTKDYSTIEVMLERYEGRDETMAAILRQKIAKAVVMFPGDIPSNVVTLGSHVTFRVNDGPAETRIVADDGSTGAGDASLSTATPRGVALLGLAEGERVTIFNEDGSAETLAVLEVAHQPEAAVRGGERPARAERSGVTRPPFLRVVHSSDDAPQKATPAGKPAFSSSFEDPDHDPDPSAA